VPVSYINLRLQRLGRGEDPPLDRREVGNEKGALRNRGAPRRNIERTIPYGFNADG